MVAELARADVDAQAEVLRIDQPFFEQLRAGVAGFCEHPAADFEDQAALLQNVDELCRRLRAQGRMEPAQEYLGADDLAATGIRLGLEMQLELAARQGQAQVVFQA
ncbi:hypothetical protein D3C71_1874370 [compost metagenome]